MKTFSCPIFFQKNKLKSTGRGLENLFFKILFTYNFLLHAYPRSLTQFLTETKIIWCKIWPKLFLQNWTLLVEALSVTGENQTRLDQNIEHQILKLIKQQLQWMEHQDGSPKLKVGNPSKSSGALNFLETVYLLGAHFTELCWRDGLYCESVLLLYQATVLYQLFCHGYIEKCSHDDFNSIISVYHLAIELNFLPGIGGLLKSSSSWK